MPRTIRNPRRTGGVVGCHPSETSGEAQMTHLACMDPQVTIEDYYRRRLTDGQTRFHDTDSNCPMLKRDVRPQRRQFGQLGQAGVR